MRYLGLDLGTRTLGISLSDETLTIANSFKTIRFNDSEYDCLFEPLKEIVDEYNVIKIVLGLPKNMNNTIGERGNTTIDFGQRLETYLNIKVIYN